jgi:hypothetical protein
MNKLLGLFGFLIVAILCCPVPSDAAQLVGTNNGECVDLPHGNTSDGTPLSLFHCHGSPNQQWTISNGLITTGTGGSCLDVQGSAPTEGAQIIIVACNGRSSQRWSVSNGQIVGIGGKCLDVTGGSTLDHAPLILSTCSSASSQQWSLQ